jgi:hypothetical protein
MGEFPHAPEKVDRAIDLGGASCPSKRSMRDLRLIFFRYCAPLRDSYTFRVLICSCGRGVQKNTNHLLHRRN